MSLYDTVAVQKPAALAVLASLVISSTLGIIALTTPAWCVDRHDHHFEGLFESCVCALNDAAPPRWFVFSQVFSVVVQIAMLAAAVLAADYYYTKCLNKKISITTLAIISFVSVIIMIVIFSVYGAKRNGLDWSYGLTVAGSFMFLAAGVMGVIQALQSKSNEIEGK